MIKRSFYRHCICVAFSAILVLLALGCTKEDNSICFRPTLSIKAYETVDGNSEQENQTLVSDVSIYIFDENELFLEYIECVAGDDVEIDYPGHNKLNIVSFGNDKGGNVFMPAFNVGDHISNGIVSMRSMDVKSGDRSKDFYVFPDDLFFGSLPINKSADPWQVIEIPLRRKIACANITVVGLEKRFGIGKDQADELSVNLGHTFSTLDFYGRFGGDKAHYKPVGEFDEKKYFVTPTFNLFPSVPGSSLSMELYHNDKQLANIIANDNGEPLIAVEGKMLNILLVFVSDSQVSVSFVTTPWGVEHVWKVWE